MNDELLVDWLSFTYPAGRAVDVFPELAGDPESLPDYACHIATADDNFTVRKPRHGYAHVAQNGEGISVLWNGAGSKQGLHITYPGSSLAERDALKLAKWHTERGARCTRLDIAIDVYTEEMTVNQLATLRKADQCDTRSRNYSHIESSTGETLYIGSRTSEQFLRIYDKGAERGGERDKWLRIELELKGKKAEWTLMQVVAKGLHIIPSVILGFIDFPACEKWAELFANQHKLRGNRATKAPDVDRWILYKILPTIARRFVENPALQSQFNTNLQRHMDIVKSTKRAGEVQLAPIGPNKDKRHLTRENATG